MQHKNYLYYYSTLYLLSSRSRISIRGCLGFSMVIIKAASGMARLTSALKNSVFSGRKSSTIVTLKSCRLLPGGKVI